MTFTRRITVILLCLFILLSCADTRKRKSRRSKRNHMTCRPRSLVRYQMTVHTAWDKETFPKMFPIYRPPAHWSQLIGRSHGNDYKMWQEKGNASLAVQRFAEKEDGEIFDLELSQGYNGVLDAFVAPTIETGVGMTSAVVSLDGRHSQVSFMMKIVPSPDWFIGLDSAELCYRGRWRKTFSRDLQPFDAGTDQGLTFTSPRWPNIPQEPISAITSSRPNHPASSFFYPEYKVLPRIAYVEFEMISEYRLRRVHRKIKPIPQPIPKSQNNTRNASHATTEMDNVFKYSENSNTDMSGKLVSISNKNVSSELQDIQSDSNKNSLFSLISTPEKEDPITTTKPKSSGRQIKPTHRMRSLFIDEANSKRNPARVAPTTFESVGRDNPDKFERTTQTDSRKQQDQSDSSLKTMPVQERLSRDSLEDYQKRVDCQVSEWSDWSACSQTCGFGNKQRSREVIDLPRHGGSHCPLLKEETLCGSMRNCQWKHFSGMSTRMNPPFRTLKRRRRRRH